MKRKFFTKNGWLTLYALGCGYRHHTEINGITVTLSENNIGLNTFDVVVYSRKDGRILWDIVEGLPMARAAYIDACKTYTNQLPARRFERASDINRNVYA